MSDTLSIKNYPSSTDETAKMMGFGGSSDGHSSGSAQSLPANDLPVANLPVAEDPSAHTVDPHNATPAGHMVAPASTAQITTQPNSAIKIVKAALPYVAIFAIGLFLYYFFFTNVNFSGLFKTSTPVATTTPQQNALQQLETQDSASYQAWIASYYYSVSDPKIIDPNTDNSGNGLSNFQKYLLNLNPKYYDTLGLGMPDSQTLADGINPATDAPLTDSQKDIVNKYIDLEVVMNRLALSGLEHPGQVAGANVNTTGNANVISIVPQGYNNGSQNTQPANNTTQATAPAAFNSPTTGADLSQGVSENLDINTKVPGLLSIPDLKISAPILWPGSSNDFDTDLESGVIHYPGTALPGQIGTTYIAGHSSNYVWAKGNYNHIFTYLNNLKDNASFSITVTLNNGKTVVLHYVVTTRKEFTPTDPAQIANTGQSLVALSTCWPVNTTSKRLVLYGQLTQIEQQ